MTIDLENLVCRHEQWQCPGLNANANGFWDTQINANVNANGFLRLLSMPMSMPIVFSAPYQCQFQCQCAMFWLNVNANVNTCINDLPLFMKSRFKYASKLDWSIILLILVMIRGCIALDFGQNWQNWMGFHPIDIEPKKGQCQCQCQSPKS